MKAESVVEAVWSKMDVSRDGLVSFEEWMSFMNPASDWIKKLISQGSGTHILFWSCVFKPPLLQLQSLWARTRWAS